MDLVAAWRAMYFTFLTTKTSAFLYFNFWAISYNPLKYDHFCFQKPIREKEKINQ